MNDFVRRKLVSAARLETRTQSFIDSVAGGKPLHMLSPRAAREVLLSVQASAAVNMLPANVEDRVLDVGPTGSTSIRIYRPTSANTTMPAVVYLHGGGWVLGDKSTHERLLRELTASANAVFVFVDYERSPEAHYPVAVEQAYAVLEYIAANPCEFDVDPSRLAVAGDSVGGNMAAVLTLLAKERGGPPLSAQLMFYPVTDASMSSPSYYELADGPWLTRKAMEWFWDHYLPDPSKRQDPYVSPINASLEQLHGLPPALLITDENDVLRDEGEAYGRKLSTAGVRVTAVRYIGTIHDFMLLNSISETPAVRSAVSQASNYLRSAFE